MYKIRRIPQITDMEILTYSSFLNALYCMRAGGGRVRCKTGKIRTQSGVRAPDDRENAFPVRPQAEGR